MAFRSILASISSTSLFVSDPWNVGNARYSGNSFSSTAQTTSATGLFFKSDGLSFWICAPTSVFEYSVSTAWDLSSSVSFVRSYSFLVQESTGRDVFFKSDGTKMFILGGQNDNAYEYSLSTAWDISSASFTTSFYVGSQEANPRSFHFKSDGTKMYVIGNISDAAHEYDLSTAWDLSTTTYSTSSFSVSSQTSGPLSISFKSDGTKMYVIGGSVVYQYSLSTAWDVTTASYDSVSKSVSSQETTTLNHFFKPDGTKLYIVGISDVVYEYDV